MGLDLTDEEWADVCAQLGITPETNRIHTTLGVYNGLFRGKTWLKRNGVPTAHLRQHIAYNRTMRFGRCLLVDGVCLNRGYLTEERVEDVLQEIRECPIVINRDTAPYW